ncbi:F0F1 ATP synthase subunit epsilon [Levilactobacillus paucivorans]|uniref:ATP synthase epsilon chain n=1 Tax=Levilactobacillus paucivorans TaxID=616990 RepID=A0A0R2LQN5_9LACO|nr:F0F1 ATP synthase subunit epsilon [Levilactobacillus paucivorans]KRO03575.1 F0F1 ATP synthase subunit epsilon [Levilactobacillus paucivorans]
MADKPVLSVSIVTPDGRVYEQKGDFLIVTTSYAPMGILPNHVPVLATLKVDEVRFKHDGEQDRIAVNGGFIEFSNNVATIVADSAERQGDIDVSRAQSAQERAKKAIEKAKAEKDPDNLARAEVALRRAINRINVANH